jgi:Na+-transporting NADH:ubiquinone oxidoreductase subunit C
VSSERPFNPNSLWGTVIVAAVLCLVCSLVVSATAVGLRPRIDANRQLKLQRNVLVAAGRWREGYGPADVEREFRSIERVLITLPRRPGHENEAGLPAPDLPANFDPRKAAKDPKLSVEIPPELDRAKIKRREIAAPVYLVKEGDRVVQYVLPVYGKGLWSTLYGFVALEADLRTISGITFYEHGETPGLGGEVDNERWKEQWRGKSAFDEAGEPQIDVIKGRVEAGTPGAEHQIDGLSGATITSNGVEGLVNYWLGADGFGPYFERVRTGDPRRTP